MKSPNNNNNNNNNNNDDDDDDDGDDDFNKLKKSMKMCPHPVIRHYGPFFPRTKLP